MRISTMSLLCWVILKLLKILCYGKPKMKQIYFITLFIIFSTYLMGKAVGAVAMKGEQIEQHQHEAGETHGSEAQSEGLSLTQEQLNMADIQIAPLIKQFYQSQIYAPGEIKANGYTSYLLSPRVDSIVVKRYATLGQHIAKGSPLVTLFSADVATAQTNYRLAQAQWQRLKKMTPGTVSEKDALTTRAEYEVAYSQLAAFGLIQKDIEQSIQSSPEKLGEYTLYAQTSGVILSDNFAQGQRVDSGTQLMLIADESNLWVEAQLSANQTVKIAKGANVQIQVNGKRYPATVSQEAHTINQVTRSRIVRLNVENSQHQLHPGMFSDVYFSFPTAEQVLAVPEQALVRTEDGDWAVFVVNGEGEFVATEVELGVKFIGLQQIKGLTEGAKVVIQGAFFVASEQAKGGFDPHNH